MIVITVALLQVLVLLLKLLLVGVRIIYEAATSPSCEHEQVTLVLVTEA